MIDSTGLPLFIHATFLDTATCAQIRAAMDRGTSEPAEIAGADIELRDAVRRTRSIEIDHNVVTLVEQRLEALRPSLERTLRRRLGPREGTGFLRYDAGGFYRRHRDRGHVAGWPGAARRSVAVVLFLNSAAEVADATSFSGGTLYLYPEAASQPVPIVPTAGLVVAFPAELPHEVLTVRDGVRDTAVDWFYDHHPT